MWKGDPVGLLGVDGGARLCHRAPQLGLGLGVWPTKRHNSPQGPPAPEIINEVPWLRAPPHLLAGILHFSDGL